MQSNHSAKPRVQHSQASESMTFTSAYERRDYIREQRQYGWEVFLNFVAKDKTNAELYTITRRAL